MPDTQRTVQIQIKANSLEEMVGKELNGFTIQQYTEVYKVDDGGTKTETVRYFKDHDLAEEFIRHQPDPGWYNTEHVFLLTYGEVGFLMGQSVTLVDDEDEVASTLRQKIFDALSPYARKLLAIRQV
jgi:hypothetical protein